MDKRRPTLKKISGTKMVPLGHRLVVRKMVPFGPFLPKKAPFSKMVPQGHRFSTLFSLSAKNN